jgi:hypothetical protein
LVDCSHLLDIQGVPRYAIPFSGNIQVRVNAEQFEIGGRTCRLISLPDLVRAKEAMGREKDLLAAKELRAIAAKRTTGKSNPGPS